ncbi:hypothetical protein Scep_007794 [Stephania cephalantha]|uniref:Uncharacterized protein n=1 Tax=Stephania cephalantha TaxID=152367 RepID=A0AAP0KAS4_9MAGN
MLKRLGGQQPRQVTWSRLQDTEMLDMARSKTGVSREQVYWKSKRTEQAVGTSDTRGGKKRQTASYRKEKQ